MELLSVTTKCGDSPRSIPNSVYSKIPVYGLLNRDFTRDFQYNRGWP